MGDNYFKSLDLSILYQIINHIESTLDLNNLLFGKLFQLTNDNWKELFYILVPKAKIFIKSEDYKQEYCKIKFERLYMLKGDYIIGKSKFPIYYPYTFTKYETNASPAVLLQNGDLLIKECIISNCVDHSKAKFLLLKDYQIIDFDIYNKFAFFINYKGELFKYGVIDNSLNDQNVKLEELKPVKISGPYGKIIQVVCNGYISFINNEGEIYPNSDIPHKLEGDFGKVIQVQAGNEFIIFLDENGKVYVLGQWYNMFSIPTQLITEEKIIQISCNYKHVLFLSETGKVYTAGHDLDISIVDFKINPIIIKLDKNVIVKNISAGYRTSAFVTIDNKVYILGNNPINDKFYNAPRLINILKDKVIDSVHCAKSGQIYVKYFL